MRLSNIAATSLLLAGVATAHAQYRCDCTSIVDTCSAEIVARGTFLEIKTDRPMCARVDYFVDGQPFVSVVVDGEHREDWLARTTNPRILVQSCHEYPDAARERGLRGSVEVEFTVTPQGTVEAPRVVTSEPQNVFDSAALAALSRRRYPADAEREPRVLTERIEFAPPRAAREAPRTADAGPLNRCVREDAVYNYGEMVDVGLINACTEPLVVFGCAHGIGKDRGRWMCSDSEQRGDILVQKGDQRLGRRYSAGDAADLQTYTYRDSFSLTRAPNSQLWWVACAETGGTCRSDARLWTRAISGQNVSVDPQARSPIALARSD